MSKKAKILRQSHIKLEDLPQEILVKIYTDFLDFSDWGRIACSSSWQWNIIEICWSTVRVLNFYSLPLMRPSDFKTVIKKCTRLKKLRLDCTYLDLSSLAYIPTGLQEFRLESLDRLISDPEFLPVLERFQFLNVLKLSVFNKSLSYKIVQDQWLNFLSTTNIASFEIENIPIVPFNQLKNVPGLSMDIIENFLGLKKLKIWNSVVQKFPSGLEKLKITSSQDSKVNCLGLNDMTFRILENSCSRIKKLKIVDSKTRINDNDSLTNASIALICKKWSKIKHLWLTSYSEVGVNYVDENSIIDLFNTCCDMRTLGLDNFKQLSDICVEALCNKSPNLETLSLSFTRISDSSLIHISSLKKLQYLSLRNCKKLSEPGLIELLRDLPELEALNFSATSNITDQVISVLASNCRNLKQLVLNDARITSLEPISNMANLSDLSIVGCKGLNNSENFRFLVRLHNLCNLTIVGSKILTHDDFAFLMDGIGKNLRKLRFDGCQNLNDQSFLKIAQVGKRVRILTMKNIVLTNQILGYLGLMWSNLKQISVSNLLSNGQNKEITHHGHEFRIVLEVNGETLYFSSS
ncbi:unnamed protein product [Blepharisma stoltei]|uniref:F-box domain-containing protein n=1 Tax=Blepharisma stoltei TaxID=1481888 RepID=A0AAU9J877_9CILI|nr:unnamed protein product [Blepharisma stoltei]